MEFGDKKQICRLCLEIVPPGDAETIGEKKKEILEVLLINVDLHIVDNAVACSKCMEEALSGFEFKSACFRVGNCISTFVDAGVPVDMKKIFQEEMKGTAMENINLENRQICRLCMSLIEDKALDCNTDLKDIITNCLPEVEIHTVHEPLVCELCFSRMKKLNEFMKTCQEIEQRINNYYLQAGVDHAIPISVNLNDLLKFKDYTISGFIKVESSNFDSNLVNDPKKEDIANIECQEIHIKDELDSGDDMGASVPSGACDKSGRSGSLKSTSKGRKHFSSDGHMAKHRGVNKEFSCQECTYKTARKDTLARHMVTHKDKSEVEMHKCENCEYETRYKSSMRKHMVMNHDPTVKRKFKCEKCVYETNYKSSLRRHKLVHKNKSEVEMHTCANCGYKTRHKRIMSRHMGKHRDLKAEKRFKCDKCQYKTDFNSDLRKHTLIHKEKSEVEMYKCENCEYETRDKSNMIHHMVRHRDPRAEKRFKCDKCPYATNFKWDLRSHTLSHKDKSEVEMHKCENCDYETRRKGNLVRHMLQHRGPKPEKKFKCDKCPYETNFKYHLRTHNVRHKDKSEVEMHKCANCEFKSKWKASLTQHMIVKHSVIRSKFKCDKCPYETDLMFSLRKHNLTHEDKSEEESHKK